MKIKTLLIVLIFSPLFLTLSCSKDNRQEIISAQLEQYLAGSHFQGAVLVGKGNKIIFAKGYGLCDSKNQNSQPVTVETTFEAGSITKQITAAAILQLVKKHKLSLDDKIIKFFPEFPYGEQISIEMLLNMRSGLTDCINAADEFFPKKVSRKIEKAQLKNQPVEANIVMEYLNQAPLLAPPDSTYFYCNTNYILLAKIIEQVSGQSFEEYIQKNIFEKCKMTSSNLQFQQTQSKGYDYKGRYYSIPEALSIGCGNLNTNVLDLFKWNQALSGGKVISKKYFKKMIDTESYGYGVYRKDNMIFHGGNTNVFNSYNAYYLDSKVSIIILVNRPISESNAALVARTIYKIYTEEE